MKIDPVALTQKLTEANVHPGFYKMLGLKGPAYRWVKCPIGEVKVGDTIKIVEYDEIPKNEYGNHEIPEGWIPSMQDRCGKEFKVGEELSYDEFYTNSAIICGGLLVGCISDHFCWHDSDYRERNIWYNLNDNLFYVRREA